MLHKLKKISIKVSTLQKSATSEFLRYGIERKFGAILRCEPATHDK